MRSGYGDTPIPDRDGEMRGMMRVRASWDYTWAPGHPGIASPHGVRFVPMIWGAGSAPALLSRLLRLVNA
jgi:hypothetical protein